MKLYRYIPFEILVDILINEKLTLMSPAKWEDSYEGWFWKAFLNSQIIDKKVKNILDTVFAQCWSKKRDAVALWSIYSYDNKAIMIESTKEKLSNISGVSCQEIEYSKDASISIDELIEMLVQPSPKKLILPFTKKRSAFRHENEVRIYKVINSNDDKVLSVDASISPVIDFVNNVTVHPFAPDWYVDIVKSLCEMYNIPFNGKSKLYDYPEYTR